MVKIQRKEHQNMDFDKELIAFRKRVLHLEDTAENNQLPIAQDFTEGNILLYETDDDHITVSVYFYDETFWLTQKAMANLFDTTIANVNMHIQNIYSDLELYPEATIKDFLIVQNEGNRKVNRKIQHYNLDMIVALGYRINSKRATQFRQWATKTLKEYIIKGFVINDDMLKNGKAFGKDYFDELLERIKEIRASERRFYQKITDIYSQCSYDYDSNSELTQTFFKTVQNKLIFAITKKTAAEIIHSRADSAKEHMGLTTWKKAPDGKISKSDVTVSKNYLTQKELSGLNDIVVMYLDYAENQAKRNRLMSMQDWVSKLDAFLKFNEYDLLNNSGFISNDVAKKLALHEYEIFRVQQDADFVSDFDKATEKYIK